MGVLKENTDNLGLTFLILAIISISYDNIVLTKKAKKHKQSHDHYLNHLICM